MLQRDDHRAGVEPEDLGQVGAADPPLLARGRRLLLEVGEHVLGPVDLDARDQVLAQSAIRSTRSCPRSTAYRAPAYIPRDWCTWK